MGEPVVLHSDGDLVVVAKPAGLRIHPADDDGQPDLATWLGQQPDLPRGVAPVHRLDGPASGLVLCAASKGRRAQLGAWFAEEGVRKTYLVLVHGHARRKGTIARALKDPRRKRSLEATTRYWLHEQLGGFSLLRVVPETGRKHQIRRHLSGLGLPVVGDDRWGPRRKVRVPAWPGRLWLHAWRLELPDGSSWQAPLPPELERNLDALRWGVSEARRASRSNPDGTRERSQDGDPSRPG